MKWLVVVILGLTACGASGAANPVNLPVATAESPSPAQAAFSEIVLTGQGSRVTDQFELPSGNYKVSWAGTSTDQYGGNMIAYMVGLDKTLLMATQDLNGSTLFQSSGGFFFLQIDASAVAWKITIDRI